MKTPKKVWIFFQPISFQVLWLTLVLGGNQWLAMSVIVIGLHFFLTPTRKADLKVLPIALIGFCIDMIFTQAGIFEFSQWPFWLLILWLGFVLNFGHSLQFLRKLKLIWIIAIGAIGGTYSYWVSFKLGAVMWPFELPMTLIIVAISWASLLPTLVKLDVFIRSHFVE